MKVLLKVASLLLIALLLSNCSSTNMYMVKDSGEYGDVTSKIVGDWAGTEFVADGSSQLSGKYEKMTADFDFMAKSSKITLWIAEGTVAEKLLDWKKEFPGIKIDEYKVTYTSNWLVSDDGENLEFYGGALDIVINGDGENFEGFVVWEKTKLNATKSAYGDGGLFDSAIGSITKSATGTGDLFPEFTDKYEINLMDDDKMLVLRDGSDRIKLVK